MRYKKSPNAGDCSISGIGTLGPWGGGGVLFLPWLIPDMYMIGFIQNEIMTA